MSQEEETRAMQMIALNMIGDIYKGISDIEAWNSILSTLVRSTSTSKGLISLRSPVNTAIELSQLPILAPKIINIEPYYIGAYLDHYYKIDPWTQLEADMADSAIIQFSDLLKAEMLKKTIFYKEFLFPQDIQDGFALILAKGQDAWVILNLFIDSNPRFSSSQTKELLQLIAPHLRRAFCSALELALLKTQNLALSSLFDRHREGICLLNERSHILFQNTYARSILETGDGLYVKDGIIHATHKQTEVRLQTLILSANYRTEDCYLRIPRKSTDTPLKIYLTTYAQTPADSAKSRASVILVISDPAVSKPFDVKLLENHYFLTPAEAKLAASIGNGTSLKDYAINEAISFNTARWHLRNVFDKVGVKSQQELIRQLMSTPIHV